MPHDVPRGARPRVRLAHTSDVHIGLDTPGELDPLAAVLATTAHTRAHVLLLAGDIFDHARVGDRLLGATVDLLERAATPIVILPGNHDCLIPESIYRRPQWNDRKNVTILGLPDDTVGFPDLALTVWGRAHPDYFDMSPLADVPPRGEGWSVVMAHGQWHPEKEQPTRSYIFRQEDLDALDCDYLALGHWDHVSIVGAGPTLGYYSGNPHTGAINLVDLDPEAGVVVRRQPLVSLAEHS
jgi:DNA repair exonuclease SbcCD nuclease subunit